jgi:hypothetical protein
MVFKRERERERERERLGIIYVYITSAPPSFFWRESGDYRSLAGLKNTRYFVTFA